MRGFPREMKVSPVLYIPKYFSFVSRLCGYFPRMFILYILFVVLAPLGLSSLHFISRFRPAYSCESSGKKMKTRRITEQLTRRVSGIACMRTIPVGVEMHKRERRILRLDCSKKCPVNVLQFSFAFKDARYAIAYRINEQYS